MIGRLEASDQLDSSESIIRTYHLRKYALNAIGMTSTILDTHFKIAGLYLKERQNEQYFELAVDGIRRVLAEVNEFGLSE